MLDFVRKYSVFRAAEAEGLPADKMNIQFCQRVGVQSALERAEMCRIGEIAPKTKTIMDLVVRDNDTYALPIEDGRIKHMTAYFGEGRDGETAKFDPGTAPAFDIIYSCGAYDQLSTGQIGAQLRECLDILKPGGVMVHTMQFYISASPTPFWFERLSAFLEMFGEGMMEPIGEIVDPALKFEPDMATSSDEVMFGWYQGNPDMAPLRVEAQNVCLVFGGRRVA